MTKTTIDAIASITDKHFPILLPEHSMGAAVVLAATSCIEVEGIILPARFWWNLGIIWALLPKLKYMICRIKPFKLMKTELDDPRLRLETQKFLPEFKFNNEETVVSLRDFCVAIGMFDELRTVGLEGC